MVYQKYLLGYNLEGLGMEKVLIFYCYMEYFNPFDIFIFPFAIFCGRLVYFFSF
jgi:hypothetical protein